MAAAIGEAGGIDAVVVDVVAFLEVMDGVDPEAGGHVGAITLVGSGEEKPVERESGEPLWREHSDASPDQNPVRDVGLVCRGNVGREGFAGEVVIPVTSAPIGG